MTLRHTFLAALVASSTLASLHAQPAPRPPGTLQITLLGTGNPRPNMERFGPSILVEAGARRILIDAGRGATQRLFEIGARDLLVGIDALSSSRTYTPTTRWAFPTCGSRAGCSDAPWRSRCWARLARPR